MSLELQEYIFEKKPKRRELLQYCAKEQPHKFKVQVFRNHSFELIEHTISVYLDYAGVGVSFSYSNYDDSFSFLDLDTSADLVIVWIDGGRYPNICVQDFLTERLQALRAVTNQPVLVLPFRTDVSLSMADVLTVNLSQLCAELGTELVDERTLAATGTALSSKAMLHVSKALGLQYLPALLQPTLKGLVVDFDNTLYQGVLGEDGIQGVTLTPGHKALQQELKQLAGQGFFLCAASKNELEDVCKLLDQRADFPLKREDFTKLCVSWQPKEESIEEIARYLNIHTDSLLFIDDNIGELTSVQMRHPQIRLLHAKEDAFTTLEVLRYYPGLLKLRSSSDDAKRSADVRSNEERSLLRQTMSHSDYIKSLELKLTYVLDDRTRISRVAELSNKTNQFIFNYKRYSEAEVEQLMSCEDTAVLTLSLSDRLSDSGLVGVFAGRRQDDRLELEECFVSCRALGRGIDEIMVCGAISILLKHFGVSQLHVQFQPGPRNKPAEAFVNEHLSEYCAEPMEFAYELPQDLLTINIFERN